MDGGRGPWSKGSSAKRSAANSFSCDIIVCNLRSSSLAEPGDEMPLSSTIKFKGLVWPSRSTASSSSSHSRLTSVISSVSKGGGKECDRGGVSGGGAGRAGGVIRGVDSGVPSDTGCGIGGVMLGGDRSAGEMCAGTPCRRSRCVRKKYLLQYSLQHISQNASGLTTPSRRRASG